MPKPYFDLPLAIPISFIVIFGLLVLRSIAPNQLISQLVFLSISLLAFIIFSLTDYRLVFSLHLPIFAISMIFLLAPFVFGEHSRGALRWIQIGNFALQPSELIKPFLLVTFSSLAARNTPRRLWYLLATFLLPATLVFIQPDLGTVLVISVGWLTIFASKLPLKKIFISALVMSAIIPLGWFLLKPYQQQRIRTFIDPYADPLGAGYHVIQSITSVGSGQLFGRGLGHGTQSQLRFLPEHYTDFIFASLSEELGFTGSALIIALYLLILWRVYSISQSTPDPACAHYALGLVSMLFFQIFVNIGMNMGIAPVTGITLPFISAGGSSLLSLAISIGILTSISKSAKSSTTYQIR